MKNRTGRPRMKQINAFVHERDIESIDTIAESDGINRSEVVRRAVKFFLDECQKNKTLLSKSDKQPEPQAA